MIRSCTLILIALIPSILAVAGCGAKDTQSRDQKPGGPGPQAATAVPPPAAGADWRKLAQAAAERGATFLLQCASGGKWGMKPDVPDLGISAIAARAVLVGHGAKSRDAVIPALEWLVQSQKEDGGIYDKQVAVYVTAASVMALKASGEAKYRPAINRAVEYLRVAQTDEAEGRVPSSEDYGGVGYGGKGDVNLSTTQFAVEAASDAGLPKDDAFYRKALMFLQRCQNRSESNDARITLPDGTKVEPGNDGGGYYRPGESKAGLETLPDGRRIFRSYGSMTYALLKSYLLCDLDARDPRVKACLDWVAKHWELEFNPGMEFGDKPEARYQGLYYYYLTLARTLAAAERQKVDLAAAGLGRWREDLARRLLARQAKDGSWVNSEDRWFEGAPALVTSYSVLALGECLAP